MQPQRRGRERALRLASHAQHRTRERGEALGGGDDRRVDICQRLDAIRPCHHPAVARVRRFEGGGHHLAPLRLFAEELSPCLSRCLIRLRVRPRVAQCVGHRMHGVSPAAHTQADLLGSPHRLSEACQRQLHPNALGAVWKCRQPAPGGLRRRGSYRSFASGGSPRLRVLGKRRDRRGDGYHKDGMLQLVLRVAGKERLRRRREMRGSLHCLVL